MRRPDVSDGEVADHGQHVLLDAGAPLPAVLGVLPAVLVAGKALLEALTERHRSLTFGKPLLLLGAGAFLGVKRINAVQKLLAHRPCLGASIGEADRMRRAEANVMSLAEVFVPKDPRPRDLALLSHGRLQI